MHKDDINCVSVMGSHPLAPFRLQTISLHSHWQTASIAWFLYSSAHPIANLKTELGTVNSHTKLEVCIFVRQT